MTHILAQIPDPKITAVPLGNIGGDVGLGPFGSLKGLNEPATVMQKLTGALSSIIGLLTLAAAFWFFIQFTIGGIAWITSAGDKQKLTQARDKLSNAFVGLVIVVAGWAVLALVGQFFGWDTILLPNKAIEQIKFGAETPTL